MTRGVSRPALSAAALIDGITWLSSVAGPVHHVRVPSATAPASSSIRGASAASTTGIGDEPGTVTWPRAVSVWPSTEIASPRIRGMSALRYSRMCRAGLSNE